MRRIDPKLEARLSEYLGNKASLILRNLLKPPSEELYRIPGEEFRVKRARGIDVYTPEKVLERVRTIVERFNVKLEVKHLDGETFISVKTRESKASRSPELEEIKIDRIGSIRALLGRSVRGKHIITDARPGRKYNVTSHKGPFIGVGYLSDRPGSSRIALYMESSPWVLPDLRQTEVHEVGLVHPIPWGPTLSVLRDDVSGKRVAIIPAPEDMGLAAMLAKRGAEVLIATKLRGLLKRVKKINSRLGLEIKAIEGKSEDLKHYGEFDLVIVHPISSDIGLRPQPYVEFLGSKLKRFIRIQQKHLDLAARIVKPRGHIVYVANTVDPKEYSEVVTNFIIRHPSFTQAYSGVEGLEINLTGDLWATLVTRDEGPYFMVSRFLASSRFLRIRADRL